MQIEELKKLWENYEENIEEKEVETINKCFENFKNNLTLELYAKPNKEQCSYLCDFIGTKSKKYYGSANPGNAYYYGISYIKVKEEDKYYIKPELVKEIQGEKYKKDGKKEVEIYSKEVAEKIFEKIKDYLTPLFDELGEAEKLTDEVKNIEKKADKPINATHFLRKIVAMSNHGKFLYIYQDEVINKIYNFFCPEGDKETNIEKNFEVTKEIKKKFEGKDICMIKLSHFLWSMFGTSLDFEVKNMILHGAPGTGKTYTTEEAIKKMKAIQPNIEYKLVQFHPSYGYEDFIEGIKPTGLTDKGQMKFELKNGVFKQMCIDAFKNLEDATKDKSKLKTYYFVADEINRAELSRVFGELLLCLEDDKRLRFDEDGNLQGTMVETANSSLWEEKHAVVVLKKDENNEEKNFFFGVPENIYFIGTMNDIDRSVDSFDMALRRRFVWKHRRCVYPVINEKYSNENNVEEYITICKNLNTFITSEEGFNLSDSYELGQSYFMKPKKLNKDELERVWNENISPILKEYLRAEYSEKEIEEKLKEAKEIFKLPKDEK